MPRKTKTNPLPSQQERTLVLIKPDGVKRGLNGQIINRLERAGLKIVAIKLVQPTKEHYNQHYPSDKAYLINLAEKTLKTYKEYGMDAKKDFGTMDKKKIGQKIKQWIVDFMSSGPVVAMVIQGMHAVDNVRMIIGPTLPVFAPPGTIRGDFSLDSPAFANIVKRCVKNLVHASGDLKEAEQEIKLWFAPEEIHEYVRYGEED